MKRFVFSIALSSLMFPAVCGTTQAASYHHRHHHYWHTTALLPRPIGTITAFPGPDEVITRSRPDSYHPPNDFRQLD
jgi:hypothetical protein